MTAYPVPPTRPVRIDSELGIEESVSFVGPPGRRMFVNRYLPLERAIRRSAVLCPPILQDFLQNYRREVVLARRLASVGVGVARFHYRGSGHSEGNPSDVGFQEMCRDALEAAATLPTSGAALAFVGARFGALVAGAAADAHRGAGLAMWEPVISGRAFFREAFRVVRARDVKEHRTAAPPQPRLARDGVLDVLGCTLHRRLHDSAQDLELGVHVGKHPSTMLLVQFSIREELREPYRILVDRFRSQGMAVEVAQVVSAQPWWFLENRPAEATDLVDRTVAWFTAWKEELASS